MGGCWGIVTELHAKLALALSRRAQLRAEAEHGVQAAVANQGKVLASDFRVVDGRVSLVHQHQDVALEFVGRRNGSLHERFQDLAAGIGEGLAERHLRGQIEGVVRGVRDVGSTVVDNHLGPDDAVAKQGSLFTNQVESLGASRQELVRNVAAHNLTLIVVLFRLVVGLDEAGDSGKVSGPAALSLQQIIKVGASRNRLAVSHAGLARDALGLVLSSQALDVNLQVQFSHARDDCLLTLGVDVDAEGGVLALEPVHSLAEAVGIAGALWLD